MKKDESHMYEELQNLLIIRYGILVASRSGEQDIDMDAILPLWIEEHAPRFDQIFIRITQENPRIVEEWRRGSYGLIDELAELIQEELYG